MIITKGRTDIEGYFKFVLDQHKKLNHTPVLVFVEESDRITRIEIIDQPHMLGLYPDDTKMMGQWVGKWKSDFFQFTAKQYRDYKEKE